MTAIGYDLEFLEDGRVIDLISIGLVTEDGREYYAVNSDIDSYPDEELHKRISKHDWLMQNVVPHLPLSREAPSKFENRWLWSLDKSSTLVKPRWVIANEVREFILGPGPDIPHIELWADYGAYDHVALCQLWGSMMRLPEGIPMWTHDLRQEAERLGLAKQLPSLPGATEHNALDDAREVMYRLRWLREPEPPF
jgi:3'-5' exoribonuclease-like protein